MADLIEGNLKTRLGTLMKMFNSKRVSGQADPTQSQLIDNYLHDGGFEYGCYCTLSPEFKIGGKPLDDIDKACRTMHLNYECMAMDNEKVDKKDACDSNSVRYQIPDINLDVMFSILSSPFPNPNLDFDGYVKRTCSELNDAENDPCSVNLCAIDLKFVGELNYFFSASVNFNYFHYGGNFNQTEKCHREWLGVDIPKGDKRCCGLHPDRKPYRHDELDLIENSKKCCHSKKLYFPGEEKCCDDGSVVMAFDECL